MTFFNRSLTGVWQELAIVTHHPSELLISQFLLTGGKKPGHQQRSRKKQNLLTLSWVLAEIRKKSYTKRKL